MSLVDLAQNAIWTNALLFVTAALGVWLAGTKLSQYVDMIADRTGIGKAFAGAMLLGGATSLPEIATTVTASLSGAALMAGTNLLGGVVMQIAVLAGIDAFVLRSKPLTFFSPQAALLMQGVLLILIIAVAMAALASGEQYAFGGVGLWSVFLAFTYAIGLWVLFRYEGESRWKPAGEVGQPPESAKDLKDSHHANFAHVSTANIGWRFALAALGVLLFGVVVARSGEAIAAQSGIGEGFIGATLVALATSLPEVSTTFSAVRFGAFNMAAANILGTNILEIALFLPADIAYREGPIFDALDPSVGLLGALGIVATCIYLWGILERRDRTIFGMGIDSAIVLTVYVAGMILFYSM